MLKEVKAKKSRMLSLETVSFRSSASGNATHYDLCFPVPDLVLNFPILVHLFVRLILPSIALD